MNKALIFIMIILFATNGICQIPQKGYDPEIAAAFDLLNNKPFAEIQLEDTSGQMFHTSSLLGKTIYVDFWFTGCAPCVKEIPFAKALYQFFADSSDIVFLSICIQNKEKKEDWKKMVREKEMPSIQLFYSLNSPQKISLPREFKINYPTYLLVNKEMKVIGYDAPRPSEEGWVHWAIAEANKGVYLSASYKAFVEGDTEVIKFATDNKEKIASYKPTLP